jgi:hypothetical protein
MLLHLWGRWGREPASKCHVAACASAAETSSAHRHPGTSGFSRVQAFDRLAVKDVAFFVYSSFKFFDSRRASDTLHAPRSEIEAYFRKHSTSPMTGTRLPFKGLVRNNQLRNVIDAWRRDESTSGKWRLLALEELKCPITMSLMHDAVVTCDGHSYERGSIIQWLRRHSTSPKSNLPLGSKALVTNRALAQMSKVLCSSQHQSGAGGGGRD